jgi:hypothetical protein
VLHIVLAAPQELRKAHFQRGIALRRGLEHAHAGARYLGPEALPPIIAISTIRLC